jgi:hypothetical protein
MVPKTMGKSSRISFGDRQEVLLGIVKKFFWGLSRSSFGGIFKVFSKKRGSNGHVSGWGPSIYYNALGPLVERRLPPLHPKTGEGIQLGS